MLERTSLTAVIKCWRLQLWTKCWREQLYLLYHTHLLHSPKPFLVFTTSHNMHQRFLKFYRLFQFPQLLTLSNSIFTSSFIFRFHTNHTKCSPLLNIFSPHITKFHNLPLNCHSLLPHFHHLSLYCHHHILNFHNNSLNFNHLAIQHLKSTCWASSSRQIKIFVTFGVCNQHENNQTGLIFLLDFFICKCLLP